MEIESIKKKVLEDVDPELKRKKAREMRKQRIIVSIQFHGLIAVIIYCFTCLWGFRRWMEIPCILHFAIKM